ncbi:hypothetical protein CEE44_04345 [Candidatus Woesearchaeota archaeon B3_Woes]|nr:MAG: hypothetical protein CEE44_04345 [Candidatus Woesearchaeota archaeon B3_Woes]
MKKATVYITTETIVLIIIAIVFLGIFLTFGRYMYSKMGGDIKDAFDTITNQRIDRLKMSEKTFDLEFQTVSIQPGERRIFFMLLKNEDSKVVAWNINHTYSNISKDIDCSKISFDYKEGITVLPRSNRVPPLVIEADPKLYEGTCLFELLAKDSDNNTKMLEVVVDVTDTK